MQDFKDVTCGTKPAVCNSNSQGWTYTVVGPGFALSVCQGYDNDINDPIFG